MPVILVDANIEGQARHIWQRMQTTLWWDFTRDMEVTFQMFRDVGLDPASRDDVVWRLLPGPRLPSSDQQSQLGDIGLP